MSNSQDSIRNELTIEKELKKAWEDFVKEEKSKKYPNIMVLGISGAGKSSLINRVFGIDAAQVSNFEPETIGYLNFYDGHDYNRKINLYDTAGYELRNSSLYFKDVKKSIQDCSNSNPIHVVWYCISVANERIEEIDLKLLKDLENLESIRGRVCVVFTKCDEDDEEGSREKAFVNVLQSNGLGTIDHYSVSNAVELPLQMTELIDWSINQIDANDLRRDFIGSQMVDLKVKKEEAKSIINSATRQTIVSEMINLLGKNKDLDSLAQYQMIMITDIFKAYGIDTLAGLNSKFETANELMKLGAGVVSTLVQTIPQIEKYSNEITSTIYVALTKAIGEAASRISYYYVEKHIKGEKVRFEEAFSNANSANNLMKLILELFNKYLKESSKEKDPIKEETV